MGPSGDFNQVQEAELAKLLLLTPVRFGDVFAALLYSASQIEMGSTNVRVGSTIFGARDYSKK
jgi:hypothetical protein